MRDGLNERCIRMDVSSQEILFEVWDTALEYWGKGEVSLIRGYQVLEQGVCIGEILCDDDVVDVFPDLRSLE